MPVVRVKIARAKKVYHAHPKGESRSQRCTYDVSKRELFPTSAGVSPCGQTRGFMPNQHTSGMNYTMSVLVEDIKKRDCQSPLERGRIHLDGTM